jgi:EAL domain-containing protein (putative c-di-GMP-specific phosphodiesterase class I)
MLHPFAVEGLVRPFVDGRPVPAASLFADVWPRDSFFIESLCRALHLRNHHNLGVPGLELFFNYDPRANGDLERSIGQMHIMAARLIAIDLDIRLLICEITESAALDRETLVRLAAEMRRLGVRLAIDDFGSGHSTLERVDLIEPDFIKIDGAWFRRVVNAPGAARLLANLFRGFQRGGAKVLVEGVETSDQLRAAIDAGADCVQGFLLGRPQVVGSEFDLSPKPVEHFIERPGDAWHRPLAYA